MVGARLKFLGITLVGVMTPFAFAVSYVVQPGETLSQIAQKKIPHKAYKVFNKDGALDKLLALNPQIKNPNLLVPGEVIRLSNADVEVTAEVVAETTRQPATEVAVTEATSSSYTSQTAVASAQSVLPTAAVKTLAPSTLPVATAVVPDQSFLALAPLTADKLASRYGMISLTPGFSFFRINATDTTTGGTALILSNVNTDFNFSWKQVFSSSWQSQLNFYYSKLSLSDPASRTISASGTNIFGFDVGATHFLSSRFRIFSRLGFKQELLLRSLNSQTLTLDRLFVPFANVGAGYDFLRAKPFTLGVDTEVGYLVSAQAADYKFKGGVSYLGRLKMSQDTQCIRGVLEGALYYRKQNQSTSVADQSRSDIGATLGASWAFE